MWFLLISIQVLLFLLTPRRNIFPGTLFSMPWQEGRYSKDTFVPLPLVIRLKKIMDSRKDKFHMLGKRKRLEVWDQS